MPPVTDETLLRYCQSVYDTMLLDSIRQEDGTHHWSGKVVELFSTLGISNSHYSKVLNTMYEVGSIVQLRRGARGVSTVIELHNRPELDDLGRVHGLSSHLTKPSAHDMLSQRVSVLERRFEGIDFASYIANTDKRLRALELKVKKK